MKYLSVFLFLLPVLDYYQHNSIINVFSQTTDGVFSNQVEFIDNGISKLFDDTEKNTIYPYSLQHILPFSSDLECIHNEKEQFSDEMVETNLSAQTTIPSNPGIYMVIQGLQDTIQLKNMVLGMSRSVEMTTGQMANWIRGLPQWDYVDVQMEEGFVFSAYMQRLLIEADPKGVEIFTVESINGSLGKINAAVYTDMVLSNYEYSEDGDGSIQTYRFGFRAVEYCRLRSDGSTESVCFDIRTGISGNSCGCIL